MHSSELKGYLTGLIFGDGFIGPGITKRSFSIKSIHKDFIDKIQNDLLSCTNFDIKIRYIPSHYSYGCNHKDAWEITVKAHPYFAKKYHHFYDDYKKRIVSKEASQWITPNGIANWYMGDGYICHVGKESGHIYSRRVDFCTDRYDIESVKRLQQSLLRFGIETSLISRGKIKRIRVKASSYEKFFTLIEPYIVDSMRYKLNLGYEYKPNWMSEYFWNLQKDLCSANALTDNAEG